MVAPNQTDVERQLAYTQQQQIDAYSHVVEHAQEREAAFNKKIDGSRLNNTVVFHTNDLVQVYRSDLDYTFKTSRKFLPKWGAVCRVVARDVNAYKLASLEGLVLKGRFSARRLCRFEPREGTLLDDEQKALVAATMLLRRVGALTEEEIEDVEEEGVEEDTESPQGGETPEGHEEESGEAQEDAGVLEDQEETPDGDGDDEGEEEIDEDGEEDEDERDDGLPKGGWGAPGCLRVRRAQGEGRR
ncbi:hypothetical protein FIBSPDRAFT_764333 [Athelia psychrophila]|uniref:Uncharacterized protein n=1 Tax=Athelia psychrophila TaxID=1759441 RepID=A0A167WV18_9AGAM|nr:hypothetical protein FIBSPDRAFT_764333 [Fibularhizoctonia sp. CBS 109695]